ncbi:MAG TPA: DUF1566 domain-containing protein [Chitinophagaceae bacterium]|nr:DUF1566 domain-containing protein [Chitinophagaceae bacterium]
MADTVDMPATTWYNGTYFITGMTNTDIGAGKSNTRSIIQQQGRTGNYAALECVKSRKGGFKDWYLPSRDELSQLYLHQNVVGTFSYGYYWSSSEIHDSSLFSWGVYFYSGVQYANQKNYIGFVRAIRSF